jgi:hypothetical protein
MERTECIRLPYASWKLGVKRGTGHNAVQGTLGRLDVLERMKRLGRTPLGRTMFFAARIGWARVLARVQVESELGPPAPIFIIGCGRSGTTLLGKMFDAHPAVRYLYEPYHLWAAIEPATDFLQLFSHSEFHCLLDASAVTATAQHRFRRMMSTRSTFTLVEKNPINTLRIGYLNCLAPDAHFVHIVRDGVDVARSIERVAVVTWKMAFRPPQNSWWGVGNAKWTALQQDGRTVGYHPEALQQLTTDAQRGAYEWLVSMREVEAWRTSLGQRLIEVRYEDLTRDPIDTIRAVMGSLRLSCPNSWLERATAAVKPAKRNRGEPLTLPDSMCTDFNRIQASFGFEGRAMPNTLPR